MTHFEQQAVEVIKRATVALEDAASACARAGCDGDAVVSSLEVALWHLQHVQRVVAGEV